MRPVVSGGLFALLAAAAAVAACTTTVDLDWESAPSDDDDTGDDDDDDGSTGPTPTGTLLVQNGQTRVVNDCYAVASVSVNVVTLKNPGPPPIAANDLVLLLRAQDLTTITSTGAPPPGTPVQNGTFGLFEVRHVVAAPIDNTVELDAPPQAAFAAGGGKDQLCVMPNVTTATIESAGIVEAQPWNPVTDLGGVVAFRAETLVLEGLITATGAGFRGGAPNATAGTQTPEGSANLPCGSAMVVGARKGEGAGGIYDGGTASCGRAFFVTGGGGGNPPRAGGGGGGNGGAGGNAAAAAAGGSDPCPFGNECGEGGRHVVFGDRLLMGGGGGGGNFDAMGSMNGLGGAGGGIVYIEVTGSISGSGTVAADGEPGSTTSRSGAGGGGAGGTVWIQAPFSTTTFAGQVLLRGGAGGSVTDGADCTIPYGVGGPGGGGRFRLDGATATQPPDLSPGALGTFSGDCGAGSVVTFGGTAAEPGVTF